MMAGVAERHRLRLDDRGPEHIHRWVASCSCGWRAVPLRKRNAKLAYSRHASKAVSNRRHRREPQPRPLTPVDRLPDALRRNMPPA